MQAKEATLVGSVNGTDQELPPCDYQTAQRVDAVGLSNPVITRALDRLAEFHLVLRATDPLDRRSVLVQCITFAPSTFVNRAPVRVSCMIESQICSHCATGSSFIPVGDADFPLRRRGRPEASVNNLVLTATNGSIARETSESTLFHGRIQAVLFRQSAPSGASPTLDRCAYYLMNQQTRFRRRR